MTSGPPTPDPGDDAVDPPTPEAAEGAGRADAATTVLDGPALDNEQMRRATEQLRSSQDKIAQAREFADEVARRTEPEPPARPGDES